MPEITLVKTKMIFGAREQSGGEPRRTPDAPRSPDRAAGMGFSKNGGKGAELYKINVDAGLRRFFLEKTNEKTGARKGLKTDG